MDPWTPSKLVKSLDSPGYPWTVGNYGKMFDIVGGGGGVNFFGNIIIHMRAFYVCKAQLVEIFEVKICA